MAVLLRLDQIEDSMLALVGGKALNLGVLTRAGLPVPDGFCVTTEAYEAVVSGALGAEISDLTSQSDLGGLRELISALPVPTELTESIRASYRALGGAVPVAVRSSATAEDMPGASFAGQQDTYLHVLGEAAVVAAVRSCWASLWTDRAVVYRESNGIGHDQVALAVVVQRMVGSTVAGVMFTANSVTGTRSETVIDASPGLGEAVVSGAVNPDHFVVDADTGVVHERRLGDKRLMVIGLAGGGTEHRARTDDGTLCLTDDQVLALTRLGRRVQDLYGAPQDIEWALDSAGGWWLTQSRPVTTLYPSRGVPEPGLRVLMCMTLAQGLTRPITPMGLAVFRLLGSSIAAAAGSPVPQPLAGPRAMHNFGERVFVDFTPILRHRIGRRVALRVFGVMESRTAAVVQRLTESADFPATGGLAAAAPVLRVLTRTRVPLRVVTALLSPRLARRSVRRIEERLRADAVVGELTSLQRLDLVERRLGCDVFMLMPTVFAYALAGFVQLALARRLLRGVAEPAELQPVLRSLPHNPTTEMDLGLWRLTEQIRSDDAARAELELLDVAELAQRYRTGSLPRTAQAGLEVFLGRYGHRAVAEIDMGMPRWTDDPGHLIGMIKNYLRPGDPAAAGAQLDPIGQFSRGVAEAESAMTVLTQRAAEAGWWRGRLVAWSLGRARQLLGLREAPKFMLVLALATMRAHLRAVGADLVTAGALDRPDDIFFVDLGDARRGLAGTDLRTRAQRRCETYANELKRRHIPRVLLSDGTEPEAVATPSARTDDSLVGSPASAGVVTSRARVVLDPVGAHLEPGEILVAPSTDPGWTPLFLTAGGLVMEMGGPNSHGAVVAREYGIPAVVGVPDATHLIQTGQLVTVDGAAGLVRPQPRA